MCVSDIVRKLSRVLAMLSSARAHRSHVILPTEGGCQTSGQNGSVRQCEDLVYKVITSGSTAKI